MKTIKLDINNQSIFNTIMDFLNNLPQNEFKLKIEREPIKNIKKRKLNAISLKTKKFKFDREESYER